MIQHTLVHPEPQRWLVEGDGLRASARVLRDEWIDLRQRIRAAKNGTKHPLRDPAQRARSWAELEGLPRASVLLLGYAAEMFLKAGLAKAYRGCRVADGRQVGLFDRDVRRFGHDYARLAFAIDFVGTSDDASYLGLLSQMVVDSARYPLMEDPGLSHMQSCRLGRSKATTGTIWNEHVYRALEGLITRLRMHASRIDADSRSPACFGRFIPLGKDGYVVTRCGGHLAPRVVFRYCREMVEAQRNTLCAIREAATANSTLIDQAWWESAILIEDDKKRTFVRQGDPRYAPE